jgi:hypothetical protein
MPKIIPYTALISVCGTLPLEQSEGGMPMPKAKASMKAFTLRLPHDLYDALEAIAETEIRPVNSQMLVILREWVERWQTERRTQGAETPSPSLSKE